MKNNQNPAPIVPVTPTKALSIMPDSKGGGTFHIRKLDLIDVTIIAAV